MEVCKARTILLVPNYQKWCKVSVAKLTATPFQLHVDETQDKPAAEVEKASSEPRQARRVYMRPQDFEQFGFASGCPKCEHEMKYGPGRTTRPHSERCRSRIMVELAKTDIGKSRLGFATDRMERAVAEHIEQRDNRKALVQGEIIRSAA